MPARKTTKSKTKKKATSKSRSKTKAHKVKAKSSSSKKKSAPKKASLKKSTKAKKTTKKKATTAKKAKVKSKSKTTARKVAKKTSKKAKKATKTVKHPTKVAKKKTMDTVIEKPKTKKVAAKVKKTTKKKTQKTKLGVSFTEDLDKPVGTGFMGIPPYEIKSGEEYMNENQRAHFRLILETWKRDLMEEVDRTVHHMKDDAANFPDPNDRATQEEEFSLELRARDRERKLIKKIEESLQDLENDEYGYCEMCGVDIGVRRLEARPTATLCIDCKTMDEIRERQGAV